MAKGVRGSSDTPKLAEHAAKARAYYAKNKAKISWRSNAWNRAHKEAGHERSRAWPKKNRERARQSRNAWTVANRERSRELQRNWHAKHPGYNARKSMECYVTKQEQLAGRKKPKRCDVCRRRGRRICFDHCHDGEHFRGWICGNCNTAIGHAHDSPTLLRKLADYLDADRARQKEIKRNAKTR